MATICNSNSVIDDNDSKVLSKIHVSSFQILHDTHDAGTPKMPPDQNKNKLLVDSPDADSSVSASSTFNRLRGDDVGSQDQKTTGEIEDCTCMYCDINRSNV